MALDVNEFVNGLLTFLEASVIVFLDRLSSACAEVPLPPGSGRRSVGAAYVGFEDKDNLSD
jgi:hypothetical protein